MYGSIYEYLLVMLTGLASAPHCIGMCGGIMSAWTLHSNAPLLQTVMAYNLGRIMTYTAVGACMGFVGSFVGVAGRLVGVQGAANILGGLFILLWVGRKLAIPLAKWSPLRLPAVQRMLSRTKGETALAPIFISGLLLGFLPCGLTYAMQMKAAATGNIWEGASTLACFGLGTLPALLCTGVLSVVLGKALRTKVLLFANALAACIGFVLIMRGLVMSGWMPSINPWLW
ncbi:sulfite exporter TauE/SafE family protein [Brevibacillus massiliensis]|nr:sulfite exporter TauE/SafE family protein [Brevibacillus massiliensis]